MGLDEAIRRAERELEHLHTAIEVHEAAASPDAVLNAYAASANLAGMILFADAMDQGTQTVRQAVQSTLFDVLPALGRTLRNPGQ